MKSNYYLLRWLPKKITGAYFCPALVFFFIGILQPSTVVYAQNDKAHETENRLKKAAAAAFSREDFMAAYPLYTQLVSLYPRDPNYNYRLGACMLFTKADKSKAIVYLAFAAKQPSVDNLANYYLGRALHLNYRFNQAIRSYQKFQGLASPADLKKYPVTHFIEMCNNAKDLLATLHGLDVLRKKELNLTDYTVAYEMRLNGGSLIAEPDEFKTKLDKEKKNSGYIYVTPDKTKAFFSSYGSVDKTGKDIYMVTRKKDGTWGAPENLGDSINTVFDEDFPVYDAPRNTLYFSSKGHNSMGGYDIFQSVYDTISKKWSSAVNLDFPINSPDDDILFVPDTSGDIAFFSSTRSSPQGKIDVYKIVSHIHPPQSVIIAGTSYKDGGKIPVSCKITVKDNKTNDVVGVYTSSTQDGKYSFSLSNGGSYSFIIETPDYKPQTRLVDLPVEGTSSMKQDIQFDALGNPAIKNYPAEMPKDSDSQFVYNYMKQQAQMDVNVDTIARQALVTQNNPPNSTKPVNSTENKVPATTSTESTIQLIKDEQVLNVNAAKAIDYASDKMEDAEQMRAQANRILNNPGSTADSAAAAQNMLTQSNMLDEKGMEAYQLAAAYKNGSAAKQLQIDASDNTNNEVSATRVSSGDLIRMQAMQVKEDSIEDTHENDELKQDINVLQQVSQNFNIQAKQTNNPGKKAALQKQVDDLSKSTAEKKQEMKDNNDELQQLHEEYTWLSGKARQADSVFTASANNENSANKANPAVQPALQQEIDQYTAAYTYNIDSAGNELPDTTQTKITDNNTTKNNATTGAKRATKKHHQRGALYPSEPSKVAANFTQTGNNSNTNQEGAIATNNNPTASAVPSTPTVTPEANPTQTTQTTQTVSTPTVAATSTPIVTPEANATQTPQAVSTPTVVATSTPTVTPEVNATQTAIKDSTPTVAATTTPIVTPEVNATQTTQTVTTPTVAATSTPTVTPEANATQTPQAVSMPTVVAISTPTVTPEVNATQTQQAVNTPTVAATSAPIVTPEVNATQTAIKDSTPTVAATTTPIVAPEVNATQTAIKDSTPTNKTQNGAQELTFNDNNHKVEVISIPLNKLQTNPDSATKTTKHRRRSVPSNSNSTATAVTTPVTATPTNSSAQNITSDSATSPKKEAIKNAENVASANSNNTSENTAASPVIANTNAQPIKSFTPDKDSVENIATTLPGDNKPQKHHKATNSLQNESLQKNTNIFAKGHKRRYSASAPIPIDPPMPEGLIFNIQVGAYRNPIPQDLFHGFQPVIGLKGTDGYIRYSTGLFTVFDTAKSALRTIRSLGYPDAFIVAFYNGKKIPLQEALAKLGITVPLATSSIPNTESATTASSVKLTPQADSNIASYKGEVVTVAENTISPSKKILIDERRKAQKAINDTVPPSANNMNEVKGLVYTVQVGSFSKPKGFVRLRKIKQLYSWKDEHGTTKYNSGIYSNVADAAAARNIIVNNTSVKDAFITAYYNNKRISITEATKLLNTGSTIQPSSATTTSATVGVKNAQNVTDSSTEKSTNIFAAASEARVIYTVQIGTFAKQLPVEMVNKLLKYANEGIEPQQDKNGITAYCVGEFREYEQASALQQKLSGEGFHQAIIIAYYHGEKISAAEAQTIK